jgi:AraC-like DNA-binding protein
MRNFTNLFFFIVCSMFMHAQELSQNYLDSLGYEELLSMFDELYGDTILQEKIARTYLNRARIENDTIKMARGYDRLARIFHPEKNIVFADSVIQLTKNIDNITYPALGYIIMASQFGIRRDLKKSYVNLLTAYRLALNRENVVQQVYILHRLVFLQGTWGNQKRALELQKIRHEIISRPGYIDQIRKSTRENYPFSIEKLIRKDKVTSYEGYVFCYLKLEKYDSAKFYVEKIKKVLNSYDDYDREYHYNWMTEAVMEIDYYLGNYYSAIEAAKLLRTRLDTVNSQNELKNISLFTGLSLLKLKKEKSGIKHLLVSDLIYDKNENNRNHHYDRLLFKTLYEYYTKEDNTDQRIAYLDKMLIIDSVLKINYQYFEPEHIKKFETPKLLMEKESLIANLELKNKKFKATNWGIASGLVSTLFLLFYYFNRQRLYKIRFEALLEGNNSQRELKLRSNEVKPEISTEVVKDIMGKLERFEQQRQFLLHDISLQGLAKKFHTNSNYLSRIVNMKMERNFSQYINDLRIEYSIKEVLSDTKLRKYTIKAIAEESGYANAESFSRAFYKKNGIYPSYYIKNLNKSVN